MQITNLVDGLARALLPPSCLHCARPTAGALLCAPCRQELPWNTPACSGCALPTPTGALCPSCAREPEAFDAAYAALRLEGTVSRAVHGLKYSAHFLSAQLLGEVMASQLRSHPGPLPHLLVPMPLARGRLFTRGYNQAQELARALGKALNIPVAASAAVRLRATADQIGKSRRQRQANVKNAFAVGTSVAGLHIALVDDVMTTGATLAELSLAAKAAGAARVEVWSAARAVLRG